MEWVIAGSVLTAGVLVAVQIHRVAVVLQSLRGDYLGWNEPSWFQLIASHLEDLRKGLAPTEREILERARDEMWRYGPAPRDGDEERWETTLLEARGYEPEFLLHQIATSLSRIESSLTPATPEEEDGPEPTDRGTNAAQSGGETT